MCWFIIHPTHWRTLESFDVPPCFYSLCHFHLSSTVLHADSTPGASAVILWERALLHRKICWETHTETQTPKWNQTERPFWVSVPLHTAILPPCHWRTSGTEWQRRGHKIPLKEQMLASSWHMPLRRSGVDGKWRGRQGIFEARGGGCSSEGAMRWGICRKCQRYLHKYASLDNCCILKIMVKHFEDQ